MKYYIEKCLNDEHLTADEASQALEKIMGGDATESQIAGLLVALRGKGETVDELVGFARTMRARSVKITIDDANAIDMCGTGGDGSGTFNVSTVASFVAAGAGVTVAKHGNRSVSSSCGSADVLAGLGVKIDMTPEKVTESINKLGIGFLFAPLFNPSMKYAAKPRTDLGIKSIFNMLGPITNPAGVRKQLIGTYNEHVAGQLANAINTLGANLVCVVHSDEGVDEITLSGMTSVFEVRQSNAVKSYKINSTSFDLPQHPIEDIRSSGKEENVRIAKNILGGERSPARNVVVANAAFGIYVSGKSKNLLEATALAKESINSGKALQKLKQLIEFSQTQ